MDALRREPFDLAFCDLKLSGESGLDLLPRLLGERPGLDVVIITAYATVDTAVEAMRRGAKDYLPKPFTPPQIRHLVDRARERRTLSLRLGELEARLEEAAPEARLETASPRMHAVLEIVARAAHHDVAVLLRGDDNVAVAARPIPKGFALDLGDRAVEVREPIALGHKVATADIADGEPVRKYGQIIGFASRAIR